MLNSLNLNASKLMTQNAKGAVTYKRENMQLFFEDSLVVSVLRLLLVKLVKETKLPYSRAGGTFSK